MIVVLMSLALAALSACASGLTIKELPELPGPALPAVEIQEFSLGPGDEVEIFVWGHEDLTRKVKITRTGFLPYPLIGDFKVTGMTAQQVRDHISKALAEYVNHPQISVSITAVRSQKIYVFGEVQRPGVYALDTAQHTSLAEAIGQAGGMTQDAKLQQVLVIRGDLKKVYIRPVDFDALTKGGDLRENVTLAVGDIIYVPTRTMASVQREARRIVDILQPVLALQQIFLNLQTGTILWDQFTDILIQGKTGPRAVQPSPIIIGR